MIYEYQCKNCEAQFEVSATIQEKTAGLHPVCPQCGSQNVSQVFSGFGIIGGSRNSSVGGPLGGLSSGRPSCCGSGMLGGCGI